MEASRIFAGCFIVITLVTCAFCLAEDDANATSTSAPLAKPPAKKLYTKAGNRKLVEKDASEDTAKTGK